MNNLDDLKEQLQEDLLTYFEGKILEYGLEIPNPYINDLCQIIVDRVNELKEKGTEAGSS